MDERTLDMVYLRMERLNQQFKSIMSFYTFPIILDLLSNIIMIIGSVCFLMINQGNKNIEPHIASFIFCFGQLAILRLIIVCFVGNMPINACGHLCRSIYKCKTDWTVEEWMIYQEIKRFRSQFKVVMFRIVFIQQSTILAMMAFIFNYIVVLLQTNETEKYEKTANGTNEFAIQ